MKNIHKTLLVATLAVSTFALQAKGMTFSDFDADNSGTVSEQEFNAAKAKRIAEKSKEGRKMRGLANSSLFTSIDTNHDGQLTVEEMQVMQQSPDKSGTEGMRRGRPPQPVLEDFDTNNDNHLTEKEYYDARNKRIANRAKEGRRMKGLANMASFADIDRNEDAKISQDEFSSFLTEHMKQDH